MGKTLEQVKAELKAAGYEGEPTVAVLKQHGWEPGNPLEGIEIEGAVMAPVEIRDELSLLLEEARANGVPSRMIEMIRRFGAIAIKTALA